MNDTSTYCITTKGGSVLHTVTGEMNDHSPWRDSLTTACGRQMVAIELLRQPR